AYRRPDFPRVGAVRRHQPERNYFRARVRRYGLDVLCPDQPGPDDRVANRVDPGLPRDHEFDPDSDLVSFRRILSFDRCAGMAEVGDAPGSAELRDGRAA